MSAENESEEEFSEKLVTTELGLKVPPKQGDEWREHTAERWKERDAESYDFAIYLVRELGLTNKSKLEDMVTEHRTVRGLTGISRNSIIALFNDQTVFRPGEIDEIIRRRSSLLTADALDKIEELLYKAKASKDLGAAAMALTAVYNVKQLSNGGATRISGTTSDSTKARTFDEFVKRAREKMAAEKQGEMRDVTPKPVALEEGTDREVIETAPLKQHEH